MATKTTIEVPVVEQTVMTEIDSQVNEEQTVISSVAENSEDVADNIATLDKEGVLARLAEKVSEEPSAELRNEVEALKVAFYKIHRADMDARRKAFIEENG
ncbi:MAG: hypothetical protein J6R09_01810, partial [Alistipes sp.]|nr:hypothetical protein [Alistipes sp.]